MPESIGLGQREASILLPLKYTVGTALTFKNAKSDSHSAVVSFSGLTIKLTVKLRKNFRKVKAPRWNGKLPYFLDYLYHLAERKSLASKVSYFDRVFLTKDPLYREAIFEKHQTK